MQHDIERITPMTVWPLRILGAMAAGAVLIMVSTFLLVEGSDRYKLWQADGIWCATLEPDGTITKSYGAKACRF